MPIAKSGRKVGKPLYVPTDDVRNTVTVLYANGIPHKAIARSIGISEPTLRRAFKQELSNAFDDLRARMVASLTRQALGGNLNAIKFWLVTRCPEWRIPKEDAEAMAQATAAIGAEEGEVVHFFMPPNYRDEPDEDEPITIDAEPESDAA